MQATAQFSDSLLALERLQLLRLLVWGGVSLLAGTSVLAFLRAARRESSVLLQFGLQCTVWGALWMLFAGIWRASTRLRDLAGAVTLDRAAWLVLGLACAAIALGATLIALGWSDRARRALVGAGIGVVTQAVAAAALALQFSAAIVR